MNYLKTPDNREYRIAKDPMYLEWKDVHNGIKYWMQHGVVPTDRKYIKDLRQSRLGGNCECLLDDNRWYYIGGSGILKLCEEEKRKYSVESTSSKDVTESRNSNSGGSSVFSALASSALDAYESRNAKKAAQMAAEREEWQAERQREREEKRKEYVDQQRKWDLENIIWGDSFKQAPYKEKIRTLVDQYFYNESIKDHELIDKLRRTANIKREDPQLTAWLYKVNENRPQKPVSITQQFNPNPGQDPKIYANEFVSLFEDPEPALRAARIAREKKEKEREALIEKARETDEQDKYNGIGRWDASKVKKNKWTAFLLSLFLGLYGAQYFYMGKKTTGYLELSITILALLTYSFKLGLIAILFWLFSTIKILCESDAKFKSRFLPLYSFEDPKFDDDDYIDEFEDDEEEDYIDESEDNEEE